LWDWGTVKCSAKGQRVERKKKSEKKNAKKLRVNRRPDQRQKRGNYVTAQTLDLLKNKQIAGSKGVTVWEQTSGWKGKRRAISDR